MPNIQSLQTLELLANSYHFVDRRCLYHATDTFERRVLFERKTVRPDGGHTPQMLRGIRRVESSILENITLPSQVPTRKDGIRPNIRWDVKARLCSVLVPVSIVYALNRWKKAFGRMLETA